MGGKKREKKTNSKRGSPPWSFFKNKTTPQKTPGKPLVQKRKKKSNKKEPHPVKTEKGKP